MDDGLIVGRRLYGQLTFESGISGISGLSGLSGRSAADAARVYMGNVHRRCGKSRTSRKVQGSPGLGSCLRSRLRGRTTGTSRKWG